MRTKHLANGLGTRSAMARAGLVLLAAFLTASACSGSTTSSGSTPAPSAQSTTVNLRAASVNAIPTAKALWRALLAQGVRTSITGYDEKGTFSLSTAESRERLDAALRVVADAPGLQVHPFVAERTGSCTVPGTTAAPGGPAGSVVPAGGVLPGSGTDRCFEVGPALGQVAVTFKVDKVAPGTSAAPGGAAPVGFVLSTDRSTSEKAEPCRERAPSCASGAVAVVDDGEVVSVLVPEEGGRGSWVVDPSYAWLTVKTPQLDQLRQRVATHDVPDFEVVTTPPAPQPAAVEDGELATAWANVNPIRVGQAGAEIAKDVRGVDRGRGFANAVIVSIMQKDPSKIAAADFGPGLVLVEEMFASGPSEVVQGVPLNPFAADDAKR